MSEITDSLKELDSHLYKVTLVVAIPNYSPTFGDKYTVSALDVVLELLSHEAEITVLDSKEMKLRLVETE
jgi:hypothetical protein